MPAMDLSRLARRSSVQDCCTRPTVRGVFMAGNVSTIPALSLELEGRDGLPVLFFVSPSGDVNKYLRVAAPDGR